MRRGTVLLSAGAALVPFVVLAFFTWARDGRPAGLVAMLGRGDLLPATALLAGQTRTALLRRDGRPPALRITVNWLLLAAACAMFPVPYSGSSGFERRLAYLSLTGVRARRRLQPGP